MLNGMHGVSSESPAALFLKKPLVPFLKLPAHMSQLGDGACHVGVDLPAFILAVQCAVFVVEVTKGIP
jgi:hypothetical protein